MSRPWGDQPTRRVHPLASRLARFLVVGSAVATVLIAGPIVALVLMIPGHAPWTPLTAWGLVILMGWTFLFALRLRREPGG